MLWIEKGRPVEISRMSLSRIVYYTDLQQQSSGSIIPLGVIAQLRHGPWCALGLIARTALLSHEIKQVGQVIRSKVAMPFKFLEEEFNWAVANADAAEPLSMLSQRFTESLFFAPPIHEEARKVVPMGNTSADLVVSELRRRRDQEFDLMLAEILGQSEIVSRRDTSELQLAA